MNPSEIDSAKAKHRRLTKWLILFSITLFASILIAATSNIAQIQTWITQSMANFVRYVTMAAFILSGIAGTLISIKRSEAQVHVQYLENEESTQMWDEIHAMFRPQRRRVLIHVSNNIH